MTLVDPHGKPMVCFECGSAAAHEHHVIPRAKGGQRTVPLCERCHGLVHFRTDDTGSLLRHAYLTAQQRALVATARESPSLAVAPVAAAVPVAMSDPEFFEALGRKVKGRRR